MHSGLSSEQFERFEQYRRLIRSRLLIPSPNSPDETIYIFFEEIYKKRLDSKEGEKAVEALEHCISTNCSWLSMLLFPCRIDNIQLTVWKY